MKFQLDSSKPRIFPSTSRMERSGRMDALARKFHETHDMAVKDEIERLTREYGKIKEPWILNP